MTKKKRNVIIVISIILFVAIVANILFAALYEGIFTIDDVTVVKLNKPYYGYEANSNFNSANSTSEEYAMHLAKCTSLHGLYDQSKFDNLLGVIPIASWTTVIKNVKSECKDLLENYRKYDKRLLIDTFGNRYYIFVLYKDSNEWYECKGVSLIIDKVTGNVIKGYYGQWA